MEFCKREHLCTKNWFRVEIVNLFLLVTLKCLQTISREIDNYLKLSKVFNSYRKHRQKITLRNSQFFVDVVNFLVHFLLSYACVTSFFWCSMRTCDIIGYFWTGFIAFKVYTFIQFDLKLTLMYNIYSIRCIVKSKHSIHVLPTKSDQYINHHDDTDT